MMHPYLMDSTWLRPQFNDCRLGENYNMIAYDMRCHGSTKTTPTGKLDTWVGAADAAFLHHRLKLPPVHILACEALATHTALRFAALFPEKVLSLTLCQVPPPRILEWVLGSTDEFLRQWPNATEQSELEISLAGLMGPFVGIDPSQHADEDFAEEIFHHFSTRYPPPRRSQMMEVFNQCTNRGPIEPNVAAAVTVPTLIVQGQQNTVDPIEYAYALEKSLVNVPGGAKVYIIKGARGMLNMLPTFANILNGAFQRFLERLPRSSHNAGKPQQQHHRSKSLDSNDSSTYHEFPSSESLRDRMSRALSTLAQLTGDSAVIQRDPRSPLSFSRVPLHIERQQMDAIYSAAKGQQEAFDPRGPNGRPQRRWSQRKADGWVGIDVSRSSAVGSLPSPLPSTSSGTQSGGKPQGKPNERKEGAGKYKESGSRPRHDDGNWPSTASSTVGGSRHRAGSVRGSPERPARSQGPGSAGGFPASKDVDRVYGSQGTQLVTEDLLQSALARRALPQEADHPEPPAAVLTTTATSPNSHSDRAAVVRGVAKTLVKNTSVSAIRVML